MMNQMDNIMNYMNMINNSNIKITNNDNLKDPQTENTSSILNIDFRVDLDRSKINFPVLPNISVKELIEEFWKKYRVTDPNEQKDLKCFVQICIWKIFLIF